MSDDFDKDDLSWMSGDDPDDQPEDESFDWDQEESGQAKGDDLGFTGELPWLNDEESGDVSARPDRLGMTGQLPWMQGEEPGDIPGQHGHLGMTGELPWMQDEASLGSTDDDDALSWLQDDEESTFAVEEPSPQDDDNASGTAFELPSTHDVPDWLRGADTSSLTQPPPLPDPQLDDAPDWLMNTDEAEPSAVSDVPDWLMDAEPEEDEESAPDWLRSDVQPLEPLSPGLPIDDFFNSLESETDTTDDDLTPEWLRDDQPVVPAQTNPVPEDDFFASLETPSLSTDDEDLFPDWLSEEQFPEPDVPASAEMLTDQTASVEDDEELIPDWLQDSKPASPTAAMTLEDDFFTALDASSDEEFNADWLSSSDQIEALVAPETPASEDFFSDLEMPSEEDLLPNWLIDDEEDAVAETTLDDDFFGSFQNTPADQADASNEIDPEFLRAMRSQDEIPDGELMRALGIEDNKAEPESIEDYIASLGDESEEAPVDWFAQMNDADAAPETMDWLGELGDTHEQPLEEPELASDGFLSSLRADFEPELTAPALEDIDTLLANLEEGNATLPDTGELLDQDFDFDTLMTDPAFSGMDTPRASDSNTLPSDMPDFLTELGASVNTVSAAAIIRQRQDRPLDELPDRLQKLRNRAEEIPSATAGADPLSDILPGVQGGLVPSVVDMDVIGISSSVVMTPDQRGKVDLLRSLAVMTGQETEARPARMSAIDLTYDSPFMTDEDDLPYVELEPGREEKLDEPASITQPRQRIRIDRIIIAIILAAAVIAPFFLSNLRIGVPPPAQFDSASRQQIVFNTIQTLRPGDLVLVGMEYGATAAAELDTTSQVLLRHILSRGARPVIVSGNPITVLRANNFFSASPSSLLAGLDVQPNDDYYVIRYLSGGALGLRALGGNLGTMLASDLRGQATNLRVNSMDEFAMLVVIAERPEDLRAWTEQVATLTNRPLLGAIGASAEPLTAPYLGSGITGLMIGYRDAYTYGTMLGAPISSQILPEITPEPSPETVEATEEATAEITAEATSDLPLSTEVDIQAGVIVSNINANVRETPARDAAIIGQVTPGLQVLVLEESADQQWRKILMDDGVEGWVAANLVRIEAVPGATIPAATPIDTVQPSPTVILPSQTPVPTSTPAPTNTPRPTSTPTTEPASRTPTPMLTPTVTFTPVQTAISARVTADQRVNVRSGPSTNDEVISAVNPGAVLAVIGRNGDGSWVQVLLPDGREGWISASLVELSAEEIPPATATSDSSELIVVMAGSDFGLLMPRVAQEETPELTDEPTPEVTAEAVIEVTEEATTAAIDAPVVAVQTIPYGEERWYAMTLGLVATIVIIALGAVVNIVRAIVRRGRS